jgi:hypothetical protein
VAIHASGTFDYVGTVPDAGALPWTLELTIPPDRRNPAGESLAGSNASLRIEEAGLTPNPGEDRGVFRPAVLRARFALKAGRWSLLARTVAQYHVDLSLVRALKPGDVLYLSRTGCGGVGISSVRDGQLVFAVGAVRSVPLGEGSFARIPQDLIAEAESVFHKADSSFQLSELPLQVSLGGETRLLPGTGGFTQPGGFTLYEVSAFRGFRRGMPGVDESVAISRRGLCSDVGARASAQLLAAGD